MNWKFLIKQNIGDTSETIIAAVSGGVDSMALLHMLYSGGYHNVIVAHFQHGIRQDDNEEVKLVKLISNKDYGYRVVLGQGKLGSQASEAQARKARYTFLEGVRAKYKASVIITAHHQDDEIETAIINLMRGTKSRGLAPMRANSVITRPLLDVSKKTLMEYATINRLAWREDPSNDNMEYLRNRVRQTVMPKLTEGSSQRQKMIALIKSSAEATKSIEYNIEILSGLLIGKKTISRQPFTSLPHKIAAEVIARWLRVELNIPIDKLLIERLVIKIKTSKPGTKHSIAGGWYLHVNTDSAVIQKS